MDRIISAVRQHPFVQRRPLLRQFVKFGLVGIINTFTSATVYLSMTRLAGFHPLEANAIAFVVAVTVSFILNKRWTFRNTEQAYVRQYTSFFVISGLGFAWSEVIIWVVHTVWGYHDLLAFALAVMIVMFWNFGLNRWLTFRQPRLPQT